MRIAILMHGFLFINMWLLISGIYAIIPIKFSVEDGSVIILSLDGEVLASKPSPTLLCP